MEKVSRAQAYANRENRPSYGSKKLFEVNPHHPIIKEMLERVKDNPDDPDTAEMAYLLYETALLNSGYVLENPSEYARNFYKIFNGALGIPRNAEVEEIEVDLDDEEEEFDEEELDDDDDFDGKPYNYISLIFQNLILMKRKRTTTLQMKKRKSYLKTNQKKQLQKKLKQKNKLKKQRQMKLKRIFDLIEMLI